MHALAVLHSNLDVTLTPAGGKPFSIQPEVRADLEHHGLTWLHTACCLPVPVNVRILTSSRSVDKMVYFKYQVVNNEAGKGFAWRGKLWGCSWWFVGEHKFEFLELPGE